MILFILEMHYCYAWQGASLCRLKYHLLEIYSLFRCDLMRLGLKKRLSQTFLKVQLMIAS